MNNQQQNTKKYLMLTLALNPFLPLIDVRLLVLVCNTMKIFSG